MSDRVCIRPIYEERGIPNVCRCINCREARDAEEALLFYRMDLCHGEICHLDPELIFTDARGTEK